MQLWRVRYEKAIDISGDEAEEILSVAPGVAGSVERFPHLVFDNNRPDNVEAVRRLEENVRPEVFEAVRYIAEERERLVVC